MWVNIINNLKGKSTCETSPWDIYIYMCVCGVVPKNFFYALACGSLTQTHPPLAPISQQHLLPLLLPALYTWGDGHVILFES